MRVQIHGFGFAPEGQVAEEQLDVRTTRVVVGTGSALLPVPGLLALRQVRMRGLVMEDIIERTVPLDPQQTRFLTIATECCRVIKGVDGTAMLERNELSNFGVWQPGVDVFVIGDWDESVSPIPEGRLPSLDAVRPAVMVGAGVAEEAAAARGKAAKD